jgi:hypothetical protein
MLGAAVIVLLVVVSLSFGSSAIARWGNTGSGVGSATSGSTTAVTLSPGVAGANLYPGGQAEVVTTISNPNDGIVQVGSLALDTTQGTSGFAVDAAHSGCPSSSFAFTTQTHGGAGWSIPVSGTLPVTMPAAISMTASAANACQGAIITVYLVAAP